MTEQGAETEPGEESSSSDSSRPSTRPQDAPPAAAGARDPASPPRDATAQILEELADDMLRLRERLDRLDASLRESVAGLARSVSAIHRDLLSERRALAARHAFDAVLPVLDSLRLMRSGLQSAGTGGDIRAQLTGVILALTQLLQGLGFAEFEAQVGEKFDPARMQCAGYAKGEVGVVLAAVQPGYRAHDIVVRPAGVLIADPRGPAAKTPKGDGK
jgi:molecular chaperone GrpE (heat shock protein)